MTSATDPIKRKWTTNFELTKVLDLCFLRLVLVIAISLSGLLSYLVSYHWLPWPVFYSEIFAFSSLAFASLWLSLLGTEFKWKIPIVAIAILAMAIIPIIQYFTGMIYFYGDALVASFYLFAAALAFSIGFSLSDSYRSKATEWLAWLFFIAALLTSIIGIIQWLNVSRTFSPYISFMAYSSNPRVSGNLNQANNYATLIAIGMFSGIYLHTIRKFSKVVISILLLIMAMACAMGQSKTSWISVAFVSACGIYFHYRYHLKISRRWLIFLTLGFAICVIAIPWIAGQLYGSSSSVIDRVSGESQRMAIWKGLFLAVKESPLWGYGWQQITNAQLAIADRVEPMIYVLHSHNLVLDLLLWNGIPIGGIIILFFAYQLLRVLVNHQNEDSWFLLAVISPLLIHAMLELPLDYAYFLLPFSLAFGLSTSGKGQSMSIGVPKEALILISFALLSILAYSVQEYRYQESNDRTVRIDPQGRPMTGNVLPKPKYELFNQLSGFVNFAKTRVKTNWTDTELAQMERVAHRYAFSEILFRHTLVLALNGKERESVKELMKMKTLYGDQDYRNACLNLKTLEGKFPVLGTIAFDCPKDLLHDSP